MNILILMLVSAVFAGILVHFCWAAFHKAAHDGWMVMVDEVNQGESSARAKVKELEAALLGAKEVKKLPLPTPAPIPNPPFPTP